MGLGTTGSETVTQTLSMRIIEDDQLPNTLRSVILRTILSIDPNKSLSNNLAKGFSGSLGSKVKRMYKYGQDTYAYGLPTCSALNGLSNRTAVLNVLNTLAGQPVNILYFKLAPINLVHVGWQHLTDVLGYDDESNEITSLYSTHNTEVYLTDIVPVYTQAYFDNANPDIFEVWGRSPRQGYNPYKEEVVETDPPTPAPTYRPTAPIVDPSATENYVKIKYAYQTGAYSKFRGSINIPVTGFSENVYYQIKYSYVVGDVTHVKYWSYLLGSEVYPTIDDIDASAVSLLGNFYPIIHLREDAINLGDPSLRSQPEYITSKRIMKYLGLDYQSMVDSIHESPDINDVTEAVLQLSVPLSTTNELERRYLFEFLSKVFDFSETQLGDDYQGYEEEVSGVPTARRSSLIIGDAAYSSVFAYRGITKKRFVGSIGPVGSHDSGQDDVYEDLSVQVPSGEEGGFSSVLRPLYKGRYWYRKQITEHVYDEITVHGPSVTYHVTHASRHDYRAGYGSDVLLLPLDHSIVKDYDLKELEVLYARSIRLIFNARQVVKTAWYESEAFRVVMIVVSVIILIFTFDPEALLATLALDGVVAFAVDVLVAILTNAAIAYGFKKLAAEVGLENVFAIAIVLYIVQAVYGNKSGSLPGLPFATDLLFIANNLVIGIQKGLDDMMEDLEQEAKAFKTISEQSQEELDKAQSLLGMDGLLDPFDLIRVRPMEIFGESPDEFYQRTVHSGNVGVIGIEAVSSYTESALSLPKAYQSLMES